MQIVTLLIILLFLFVIMEYWLVSDPRRISKYPKLSQTVPVVCVGIMMALIVAASTANASVHNSYWFDDHEYESALFEELKCQIEDDNNYCKDDFIKERRVAIVRAVSRDDIAPEKHRRAICNRTYRPCNDQLVEWLEKTPQRYGDPIWPIIIGLHETGLDNSKGGDYFLSDGKYPVSCGMTQIRTDFDGRPSCYELRRDFRFSLDWTANFLDYLLQKKRCTTRGQCISRYGGIGQLMDRFEMWVVMVGRYTEYHAEKEHELLSCLPFDNESVSEFRETL